MTCSYCGGLHGNELLDGLCPVGLLELARPACPDRVGQYEILGELDRGGMGVVYRARQQDPERQVALKMIHLGELASLKARQDFAREIKLLARFEHPNIVRIYDAKGVHEWQPFYTMQLVEGGSLAAQSERFRDPMRAARVMATVARAVQFCHDAKPMPVLHGDIKPQNILIGPHDHPYLSDFGVAKVLDDSGATRTGQIAVTAEYMAPELVRKRKISVRSEVYSLGAVLYELLAGCPPFRARTIPELLRRISEEPLRPPRERNRDVPRGLDVVCRVALEKDPARRYPSAAAFADDLERVLRGEPPQPPHQALLGRAARWMRRHRVVSAGLAGLALISAVVVAMAGWMIRHQSEKLLASGLQVNRFAATTQADAMRYQLSGYAAAVASAAAALDRENLASGNGCPATAPDLGRFAEDYDNLTLLSVDGWACSRHPGLSYGAHVNPFAFRDYFKGASALGTSGQRGAFLAPAYRSETDFFFEFAIAAPLFDPDDHFRGVLLATRGTASELGRVTIDDIRNSGRITVLIGPRGVERDDTASRVGSYVILVHPRVAYGAEHPLPSHYAELLHARFGRGAEAGAQFRAAMRAPLVLDDYYDPIPHYEGRWLAAFAPVGDTGYVVVVQSRYEDATRVSSDLGKPAWLIGLVALSLVSLLALFMRWLSRPPR